MTWLPGPLSKLVPFPNPKIWYLFPKPGKKKASIMWHFGLKKGVSIKQRHHKHVVKMYETREADEREKSTAEGYRTDEDWATVFKCHVTTVARYRRQIAMLFWEIDVNPEKEIFQTLKEGDYSWTRIRVEIFFVPPPEPTKKNLKRSMTRAR